MTEGKRIQGLDSPNIGADYTTEELEFLKAVDRWKTQTLRKFPAFSDMLLILKEMGYEKGWKDVNPKWDRRLLELARFVSSWSKDPSTQCGAVIADGKVVVSLGYNGLPQGVYDHDDRYADSNRDVKYKMIVHAETNAILFAHGRVLKGLTLYTWPFPSCSRCAVQVIQSGIRRVVSPPIPESLVERWGEDVKLAQLMFREAVVKVDFVEL